MDLTCRYILLLVFLCTSSQLTSASNFKYCPTDEEKSHLRTYLQTLYETGQGSREIRESDLDYIKGWLYEHGSYGFVKNKDLSEQHYQRSLKAKNIDAFLHFSTPDQEYLSLASKHFNQVSHEAGFGCDLAIIGKLQYLLFDNLVNNNDGSDVYLKISRKLKKELRKDKEYWSEYLGIIRATDALVRLEVNSGKFDRSRARKFENAILSCAEGGSAICARQYSIFLSNTGKRLQSLRWAYIAKILGVPEYIDKISEDYSSRHRKIEQDNAVKYVIKKQRILGIYSTFPKAYKWCVEQNKADECLINAVVDHQACYLDMGKLSYKTPIPLGQAYHSCRERRLSN